MTETSTPPVVQTAADLKLSPGDSVMGRNPDGTYARWVMDAYDWMLKDGDCDFVARPDSITVETFEDGFGPIIMRAYDGSRRIVTVHVPEQDLRVLCDPLGWDESRDINTACVAYAVEGLSRQNLGLDSDPLVCVFSSIESVPSDRYQLDDADPVPLAAVTAVVKADSDGEGYTGTLTLADGVQELFMHPTLAATLNSIDDSFPRQRFVWMQQLDDSLVATISERGA